MSETRQASSLQRDGYESFNNTGTQEVNGKEEASRTRHGVRHGQDFDARPQGAVVPFGCASDTRVWGGQMPLHRRVPKRGFTNIFREEYDVVNLDRLATLGETEITPDVLKKAGVVNGRQPVKILGNGELKTAITVHAHKFSKTAQEKITKAGGKFEVLQ